MFFICVLNSSVQVLIRGFIRREALASHSNKCYSSNRRYKANRSRWSQCKGSDNRGFDKAGIRTLVADLLLAFLYCKDRMVVVVLLFHHLQGKMEILELITVGKMMVKVVYRRR